MVLYIYSNFYLRYAYSVDSANQTIGINAVPTAIASCAASSSQTIGINAVADRLQDNTLGDGMPDGDIVMAAEIIESSF